MPQLKEKLVNNSRALVFHNQRQRDTLQGTTKTQRSPFHSCQVNATSLQVKCTVTLSLHAALPIWLKAMSCFCRHSTQCTTVRPIIPTAPVMSGRLPHPHASA